MDECNMYKGSDVVSSHFAILSHQYLCFSSFTFGANLDFLKIKLHNKIQFFFVLKPIRSGSQSPIDLSGYYFLCVYIR